MRLPKIEDKFDLEQIEKMVDLYINSGGNYFDTAYVYPGSEEIVKKMLIGRHDRSTYALATKVFYSTLKAKEDVGAIFCEQLERTGAEYFDYYLVHNILNEEVYSHYKSVDCFEQCLSKKEDGLIKKFGFSFHGTPDLLRRVLDEQNNIDFVQIQLNYLDWESEFVCSFENYSILRERNIPIIIMEPIKGGLLANLPKPARSILNEANKNRTMAQWALRFAFNLPGVLTVLSGMSTYEQVMENIDTIKNLTPHDENEIKAIEKVRKYFKNTPTIPCTGCKYCEVSCNKNLPISFILKMLNEQIIMPGDSISKFTYRKLEEHKNASACVMCGKCETVCPQHISIIKCLKDADNCLK